MRGSRILYLGKQPGWRVNPASPSGRAFVPVRAGLNMAGEVDLDLTRIRIWLGTDRFEGDAALAEADGRPRAFKDLIELKRHYARLMQEYLPPPDEASQGDALLMLKRLGVNQASAIAVRPVFPAIPDPPVRYALSRPRSGW